MAEYFCKGLLIGLIFGVPAGDFEQVGSLGTSLPREDKQTTTQAGDIVLYSGSQIRYTSE